MQFYKMMSDFPRDFYGIDPLVAGSAITPISYKDLFPLYVFNVSKQSVVDVTVKMQFSENIGANARAYALVISDRRLKLESDSKKMQVLYKMCKYIIRSVALLTAKKEDDDGRAFEEIG